MTAKWQYKQAYESAVEETQRLKAENAKLRKENTSLRKARESEFAASCEVATNHILDVGKLRDENAELRELCGDLFGRLMDKDERCGECRSQCEHDAWNFGDPKCVYAIRMRELGVEVN